MRQGRVGLVRLAASAPPAMSFVPAALKAFRAACPNVAVRSHVAPVASLIRMVQDGDAGIAVAMDDAPQRELEVEVLGEVPLVCLAPADHPLMERAETCMTWRPKR